MPDWWFSSSGRTRRPREQLTVPGRASLLSGQERKRVAGWAALRLAYLALLGGLVWLTGYLLTAPEFKVTSVRIVGNRLIPTDQILAASGIAGQNVFLLSARQAEQGVLALKPVESASLAFTWPNGATLRVVEQRPFATWRVGGTAYLVSEEGVVLAPVDAEAPALAVVDVDEQTVVVGGIVDRDVLAGAAYLQTALKPFGLGGRGFEYSRTYGLVASGEGAFRVAFGRSEDLPGKVATLRAVLDGLAAKQVSAQFIDLRIKDRPYFR